MQGISCPSKAFSLKAFSFKGRADAGRASPNPFRASLTMSFVSLCLSLVGLTFSATGMSAVPVEERSSASGTSPRPQLRPTPVEISSGDRDDAVAREAEPSGGEPAPSGLAQLFAELQTLRGEVQELRSTVEEQAHQIRQLKASQQEQYQDLDGRLVSIGQGGSGATTAPGESGGAPRGATGNQPGGEPGSVSSPRRETAVDAGGEKAAYAAAFDSMKTRQFDKSIEQFNQLIRDYPNGEMTPGSYYWLGELYLAKSDMEQSRQSFGQVIDLYPTHNKAPDALYKLGVVYHRLGDNAQALQFLDRVQKEFPNSAAAGLAKTYSGELR